MYRRIILTALALCAAACAQAHPLGIFSVNRYTRIETGGTNIRLLYVMDVAEIPSTQEIGAIDRNHDGILDEGERAEYSRTKIADILRGLTLTIDGRPASLHPTSWDISFPPGQGDLRTIRLAFNLECPSPADSAGHVLEFHDGNFADGRGWKEIVARGAEGSVILQSTVPAKDLTDELRSYPADRLGDPLAVSEAEVRYRAREGAAGGKESAISTGGIVTKTKDAFAELVSARKLSLPVMILSLCIALFLGAGHALTPGHGKTIVAAYLVGSRGTAKHAAFLGLTVTATHTAGVFALGLVAMFASQYILPGDLYPWISLASGIIVFSIGGTLLRSRLLAARGGSGHADHAHDHEHGGHEHTAGGNHGAVVHDHGTGMHTHMPPGADGSPVTWKKLAMLGVSGGLLPCPSALVVLLSAVALGRIGFGLLLIVAFSAGLAGVLTGCGLLMVYAKRFFERFTTTGPLMRWLPVLSAAVVTAIGAVMTVEAAGLAGASRLIGSIDVSGLFGAAALPVLALGFTLGLKHALDADHLVAVSTIVSGRRGILGSSIVGGLWGLGHTLSLVVVGLLVIALRIQIPERVAMAMEFTVALMLVILGFNVLRTMRRGNFRVHSHEHAGHEHVHVHGTDVQDGSGHHHHRSLAGAVREGFSGGGRSVFIGMVHGLAGSAALMLLVLSTIPSPALALMYIAIFGLGSVGGMMLMSTLIGLPFAFTARRFASLNSVIRGISGAVSVVFGLILAYQIGITQGLFIS